MNLRRKKHLHNFWRPPTNLNHQSTVSKELRFKNTGYDLNTGKFFKELPIIGIKYIIQLFNAVSLSYTMESHTERSHLEDRKTS
jgi:hypothetical protein